MKVRVLIAVTLLGVVLLAGCQTPSGGGGGGGGNHVNGYVHPDADKYQSGGPLAWMAGGLTVVAVAGAAAYKRTPNRAATSPLAGSRDASPAPPRAGERRVSAARSPMKSWVRGAPAAARAQATQIGGGMR